MRRGATEVAMKTVVPQRTFGNLNDPNRKKLTVKSLMSRDRLRNKVGPGHSTVLVVAVLPLLRFGTPGHALDFECGTAGITSCVRAQFKKFQGKGTTTAHLQPHAFDVAVAQEKATKSQEENGVFIDGRLIKITRPKQEHVRSQCRLPQRLHWVRGGEGGSTLTHDMLARHGTVAAATAQPRRRVRAR